MKMKRKKLMKSPGYLGSRIACALYHNDVISDDNYDDVEKIIIDEVKSIYGSVMSQKKRVSFDTP